VIGGIGSTRAHTALVLGQNILSCDTEKSIRDRFSTYQVSGQRAGNDDDFGAATTTALRAKTEDAGSGGTGQWLFSRQVRRRVPAALRADF
jgi:prophage tail gpP-like protein